MAALTPRFDNIPSETDNVGVGDPSSSFDVEYWKKEMMKLKSPLPPRRLTTSSPPENSRVSLSLDMAIEHELIHGRKLDANMDNKTHRRTISNSLSAQRSRIKRSQYITDMENRVKDLEVLVASLMPQVETYNQKKRQLQLENDSLRQLLHVRVEESKISEGKLEEKRQEIREMKEALIKEKEEGQPPPPRPSTSEVRPKPYSIKFYQELLMQQEMNQFISQQLSIHPERDSMIQLIFDDDEDGREEEVDQYLNLEDEIDLHQDDFSN